MGNRRPPLGAGVVTTNSALATSTSQARLDFGFHPPTVYFPLLVDEALMVEPTETETRESLDAFADAIEEILAEAETDPRRSRTQK